MAPAVVRLDEAGVAISLHSDLICVANPIGRLSMTAEPAACRCADCAKDHVGAVNVNAVPSGHGCVGGQDVWRLNAVPAEPYASGARGRRVLVDAGATCEPQSSPTDDDDACGLSHGLTWDAEGSRLRAEQLAPKAELADAATLAETQAFRTREQRARWKRSKKQEKQEVESEKDTKLAQKLGQLQPFVAVSPKECVGQLPYFGPT